MVDIGVHAADLVLMLYFGEWRATVRNLSNTIDAKVGAENSALARKIYSSVDSVLSASR